MKRKSRSQIQQERIARLTETANQLEQNCRISAGQQYRINNPHHLENNTIVEVIHTAAGAIRATLQNDGLWTIWSGWSPGQAIVKVGTGMWARTSWVEECYLQAI